MNRNAFLIELLLGDVVSNVFGDDRRVQEVPEPDGGGGGGGCWVHSSIVISAFVVSGLIKRGFRFRLKEEGFFCFLIDLIGSKNLDEVASEQGI